MKGKCVWNTFYLHSALDGQLYEIESDLWTLMIHIPMYIFEIKRDMKYYIEVNKSYFDHILVALWQNTAYILNTYQSHLGEFYGI